ncbi:MAG: transcriptional regulator [Planctomycetes bacterium]|nr:transcriptional regulator [Planctomycetota bacterium]
MAGGEEAESGAGTRRQQIRQLLEEGFQTLESLARAFQIRVKDAEEEVRHAARSSGKKLRIEPAECPSCGFVFRGRDRLGAPSRCPRCRGEEVSEPRFTLRHESAGS